MWQNMKLIIFDSLPDVATKCLRSCSALTHTEEEKRLQDRIADWFEDPAIRVPGIGIVPNFIKNFIDETLDPTNDTQRLRQIIEGNSKLDEKDEDNATREALVPCARQRRRSARRQSKDKDKSRPESRRATPPPAEVKIQAGSCVITHDVANFDVGVLHPSVERNKSPSRDRPERSPGKDRRRNAGSGRFKGSLTDHRIFPMRCSDCLPSEVEPPKVPKDHSVIEAQKKQASDLSVSINSLKTLKKLNPVLLNVSIKVFQKGPIKSHITHTVAIGKQVMTNKELLSAPCVNGITAEMFNFLVFNKEHQILKINLSADDEEILAMPFLVDCFRDWEGVVKDIEACEDFLIQLEMRYLPITSRQSFLTPHSLTTIDKYGFKKRDGQHSLWSLFQRYLLANDPFYVPEEFTDVPLQFSSRMLQWEVMARKRYPLAEELFSPNLYWNLINHVPKTEVLEQIEKDLSRTFPYHVAFNHPRGRKKLRRILIAFAGWSVDHIGYCQGLNFFFAILLMVCSEEMAFRLGTIMLEYLTPGYHNHRLSGSRADELALERIVETKLPKLWKHFQDEEVMFNLFSMRWFINLFASDFPFITVLKFWDYIFTTGQHAVVQITFGIFLIQEEELLKRDMCGMKEYLEEASSNCNNVQEIIQKSEQALSQKEIVQAQGDAKARILAKTF